MVPVYKYRIWCDTDSKWEYAWAESELTTCPVNTSHAIDVNKTSVVDSVIEDTVTVREENVPTGGHYQASSYRIPVASGMGMTTKDISFPHPVCMLAAEWTNTSSMRDDEIEFVVAPNTIVGAMASGIASGVSVLPVQQSVIDNMKVGYCADLYSASGVMDCGRVLAVNNNDNTITMEYPTNQPFSAAWPTYVRMSIHMVLPSPLAGEGRVQLGESKIGGSYIPANTVLRTNYDNKSGLAKDLIFFLEYLY